ncbi:PLP-dependent aminotransferase family protein [Candidatus Rhodoluna planktonica]|uniref:GntR family transcriptional regulator n=1 Tax=Candidatus Rhodoluna planktonica TaxID=535712 RepID=A0A1D9E0S2_9MICO|nr:PLP-dependent aminotransferase family protein [Candidatus Rhodoluna planktonica]AOY56655.1 GntR family transcriptional regulator [Candidatus Rhodoluna planktonica]
MTESSPQAHNLDPWLDAYAARAETLAVSEVRALFSVVSRPEVVSLAGGMPYVAALPKETLAKAYADTMAKRGLLAIQYGGGQGDLTLRDQIRELMALEGIHSSVEDLVVTTGSQHGLDMLAGLFLDKGDVVLAEGPSYVGAIGIFRHYEAHIEHVHTDHDGMSPEALQESIDRMKADGRTIKFLYLVPNFANPSGVTLSAERRPKILEICKREHILIIEDNPYGLLYFDKPSPAAVRSMDEDGVVYLGSFSKILAPGFRVGYVLAPPAIRDKMVLAQESALLCPSSFTQMMISEFLANADWKGQIDTFRGVYRERRDAALNAMHEYLPNLETTRPDGGFYLWITLPEGIDSKAMLPLAVKELVAYTPGTAFFGDGSGQRYLRVCYSFPTPDRINLGIKRLANVINLQTELLDTFQQKGK